VLSLSFNKSQKKTLGPFGTAPWAAPGAVSREAVPKGSQKWIPRRSRPRNLLTGAVPPGGSWEIVAPPASLRLRLPNSTSALGDGLPDSENR
jgi:hypothetical protein